MIGKICNFSRKIYNFFKKKDEIIKKDTNNANILNYPYILIVLQQNANKIKILIYTNMKDINATEKYIYISEFIEVKNKLEEQEIIKKLSRIII